MSMLMWPMMMMTMAFTMIISIPMLIIAVLMESQMCLQFSDFGQKNIEGGVTIWYSHGEAGNVMR